jgi:nucleotide-binding universal stress UspA family protein
MSGIVNLNKARKAKAKADGKAQAVHNRVKFGRPKAEKSLEAARAEKAAKALDGAKRED